MGWRNHRLQLIAWELLGLDLPFILEFKGITSSHPKSVCYLAQFLFFIRKTVKFYCYIGIDLILSENEKPIFPLSGNKCENIKKARS